MLRGASRCADVDRPEYRWHQDSCGCLEKQSCQPQTPFGDAPAQLCGEVEELLRLSEQADGAMVPPELDIEAEIVRRQHKLDNLAHAQGVLQARAKERYEMEQGQYEVLMAERAAKAQPTGRNP